MRLEIKCGVIIWHNTLLFCRRYSTEWAEEEARKRIVELRKLPVDKQQQFLIPPTDDWRWGRKQLYNKDSLVELIAGKVEPRRDKANMDRFLRNSSMNKIQMPVEKRTDDRST